MNRFLSKKKNNESVGSTRRPSLENEIPPLPNGSSRSKTFRRNKKGGPLPKPEEPEVDIAAALPSSDDFRTSLLMPNLSARFSMLREQDDPSSKIGKANDDSVLFPKRASRLDLFNHQGLSDIAEVDSRRGSLRPPFAYRTESCSTDGNGTDNDALRHGSVMSRAKPGEGNTMFGGRQKIYKIPVADRGAERSNAADWYSGTDIPKGMGGRALYESDIATSAFQRFREQEREKNERERKARPSTSSSKEAERSVTPPVGHYNRNRETTSSTNSGPSYPRTSTAATSVASQKSVYGAPAATNGSSSSITSPIPGTNISPTSDRPGPSGPKARRLYGQGLDQHMHEQQSSALSRLESLHRQRTISPPLPRELRQSRSATNLQERYQRGGPLHAPNNFRAGSPPPANSPSRMAEFELGLNEESQSPTAEKNDSGYVRSPPLSPLASPEDPTLIAALEPNDVGKATASGAFNKPKKQYDEQQYLQRQIQLQQGRQTPPPARPFSPNAASIDLQVTGRTRAISSVSTRSIASSLGRPYDQLEHQNHDYPLNTVPEAQSPRKRKSSDTPYNVADTSFLNEFSGSEVGSQSENEVTPASLVGGSLYQSPSTAVVDMPITQRSLAPEHPVRYQPERLPTTVSDETTSDTLSQRTITHSKKSSISIAKPDHLDLDSPTLGPTNGLSGLVRTHLRNESNQSSIYPEQSPGLLSKFSNEHHNGHQESSSQPHTFFNSSAMSDDEQEGQAYPQLPKSDHPEAVPSPLAVTARAFLEQATALKHQESFKPKQLLGHDKAQRILGRDAPRSSDEVAFVPSWQEQLRAHHARGGSTETEKEKEAFATELAERRRMVQDNLKSFVESESRSASPGPGARTRDDSPAKSGKSFGLLRPKNSGGSLISKNEQPSKAMKMLGINPGSNLANSSSHPSVESFVSEESEQRSRYMNDGQRAQMPPRRQAKPSSQRSSPPLPTARVNRSSSETSERLPKHRNGRQREPNVAGPNVPQMMNPPLNFAGGPPRQIKSSAPHYPHGPTERSQSAMSGRIRSNSRTNATSYFENRGAATGPAGVPTNSDSSQRPSPITPTYSSHSTPATRETPPSSSNFASPIMMTSPQSTHSYNRRPTYRKGSVNKHDISEPHFLSSTSSVNTVDLPPGASLSNGMEPPPPPVPMQNSRRKRTETLLQALGRLEKIDSAPAVLASVDAYEERGTFSADEGDAKPKSFRRHKLRKSTSEGGNLNVKARQQAMMGSSPAMPRFPPNMTAAPSSSLRQSPYDNSATSSPAMRFGNDGQYGHGERGTISPISRQHPAFSAGPSPAMHHHFPQSDVPASAVMF